ncbi:MAG: hypothetical protein COS92_05060 [Desulfobacterales bacterium CG07_land_8_20_14_0_80_52_14]|nr:MAG: hypothetical protein COX20_10710 [Desulfobacterales bacterium CG23_combo_of_CG06-09_8_20_14_all_52_9]PIU49746.1 MAG: hypothetical protein COS92_05060 [Desulfobacterales bacterium CG07_land_8_20_14_0_80_52_14]
MKKQGLLRKAMCFYRPDSLFSSIPEPRILLLQGLVSGAFGIEKGILIPDCNLSVFSLKTGIE